ncbi:MAG TPA: PAS domain-containing protein, partial [Clostridia bacterium]|nr:PAS domain-containing protein [Clostridia bacterium]
MDELPCVRELRRRVAMLEAENRSLRAGEALRTSETKFRQVIDASPVPLSVDDMKGTIEYINRKFEEKFGYSHQEIPTSAAWFARAYPNPAYRRVVARQWKAFLKRGLNAG